MTIVCKIEKQIEGERARERERQREREIDRLLLAVESPAIVNSRTTFAFFLSTVDDDTFCWKQDRLRSSYPNGHEHTLSTVKVSAAGKTNNHYYTMLGKHVRSYYLPLASQLSYIPTLCTYKNHHTIHLVA